MTKIEWTDKVWNPVDGCQKISPGCANCYAEVFAKRFWNWKKHLYESNQRLVNKVNVRPFTEVQWHPERLDIPAKWKKPRIIFLCSMGDLFNEDVPFHFIDDVFDIMKNNSRHTYLILTKRVEQALYYLQYTEDWHPEEWPFVWFGASIENQTAWNDRAAALRDLPVMNRFVSIEPLIDRVHMSFGHGTDIGDWLHWVIAGGETGYGSRPMHPYWIDSLKRQCMAEKIPFFFKGWGNWIQDESESIKTSERRYVSHWRTGNPLGSNPAVNMARISKKKAGIKGFLINGREYSEYPDFLKRRLL